MAVIAVEATRVAGDAAPVDTLAADVARVRFIAVLMDAKFEIAGVRFGLDALLGLVPGVGDTVAMLIGTYPLYVARKHRLGRMLMVKMAVNLAADWAVGLLPVAGDALDVLFRANLKNLRLLEQAIGERDRR